MGKIDLIDNGWVDLVFDGKNQAYGAYQLRKDTGRRNLKALITMFLIFAAIAAIVIAKVSIENYIASQNAAIEADVELQSLAEKKEAKAERKEEPEVEKIEIEQEIKSQDELQETNTAIGAFNVEGNDETAGEVLKAKEVIAEPEPPKVEETKVFDVVEEMPQFPGGPSALFEYLSKNIKYHWIPGKQNGSAVRVKYTVPVTFKLQ